MKSLIRSIFTKRPGGHETGGRAVIHSTRATYRGCHANPVPVPQTRLIKGDAKSASVSAASIVAKVYRDHLMALYDVIYPGYGFTKNAGYGTKIHMHGLDTLGATPIHRKTFAPVRKIINFSS